MEYFQKRLLKELEASYNLNREAAEAQLAAEYRKVLARVQRKIEHLYNDIQSNNLTSISQLYAYNKYYELIDYLNTELTKLGRKELQIISPKLE